MLNLNTDCPDSSVMQLNWEQLRRKRHLQVFLSQQDLGHFVFSDRAALSNFWMKVLWIPGNHTIFPPTVDLKYKAEAVKERKKKPNSKFLHIFIF